MRCPRQRTVTITIITTTASVVVLPVEIRGFLLVCCQCCCCFCFCCWYRCGAGGDGRGGRPATMVQIFPRCYVGANTATATTIATASPSLSTTTATAAATGAQAEDVWVVQGRLRNHNCICTGPSQTGADVLCALHGRGKHTYARAHTQTHTIQIYTRNDAHTKAHTQVGGASVQQYPGPLAIAEEQPTRSAVYQALLLLLRPSPLVLHHPALPPPSFMIVRTTHQHVAIGDDRHIDCATHRLDMAPAGQATAFLLLGAPVHA
jgi:hypothetical protein